MRILVAYSMSSTHVQTTLDYLLALKRYSSHEVSYVHATHEAVMDFDFDDFDVVLQNYCARLCFEGYVSRSYREALKRFRGLKMLAVQDEYNRTNVLKAAIRELGFHVVLTCVPQDSLEYVYPRREFPDVEFVTVLTGYVPDHLVDAGRTPAPLGRRPLVIGYRGRDIGGLYGRLAFEKYEIGRRMREICQERGIPHDIAMDDQSRIYGPAWLDFIGSCRSMLGSESGSNVFDFDGSIERTYKEMAGARSWKVGYDEFLPLVARHESEISMGQISPRAFECAAMRTPMILFRGRYSGVLTADVHYIPLEKDFSNVDEVLGRLEDLPALEAMAQTTYRDLVDSGRYGYAAFGRQLCAIIERKFDELGLVPAAGQALWARNRARRAGSFHELPTDRPLGPKELQAKFSPWLIAAVAGVLFRSPHLPWRERLRRAAGLAAQLALMRTPVWAKKLALRFPLGRYIRSRLS